jgi:nucleoside-diphosphate-sugar epimerase
MSQQGETPGRRGARVLVTGASGFLGAYVLRELHDHSYDIVASGRDQARLEAALTPGAQALVGDLAALADATLDVDTVVHGAALSSPWGTWSEFRTANVDGTAAVVAFAKKNRVRRVVFVSSPSVYAAPRDMLDISEDHVDESNRLNGYIRSKIAAERLLRDAHAAGDVPELVIIRPRGLVGVEDPSLVPRLLDANKRIGIPLFNGGTNVVDLTAVENVALALRLAAEADASLADGRAYNITNGEPREFGALVAWLFERMGITPRYRRLNRRFAYGAAAVIEALYGIVPGHPEPPLTRYTLSAIAFSQTLDITRAREELGYEPRVPLDDALARVAAAHGGLRG